MAGKKGKSGPPRNMNSLKSGVYLAQGRLPAGCGYVAKMMYRLRRELEQAVLGLGTGEVGIFQAALIQSATRHETRAQLLQRYLRESDDLTLAERMQLLDGIGKATDSRDRCLERLRLNAAAEPIDIGTILATAHEAPEPSAPEPNADPDGADPVAAPQAAPVAGPCDARAPDGQSIDPASCDAADGQHARHDGGPTP